MATMRDIVRRAYRAADISSSIDGPTADEAVDGLETLNGMLHSWALEGVDVEHTTLGLSDAFPLASKFEDGAVYMLAARFGTDVSLPVGFDPDGYFRAIQAAYVTVPDADMPISLRLPPSRLGYWDGIE